jgi:hypothetical protein
MRRHHRIVALVALVPALVAGLASATAAAELVVVLASHDGVPAPQAPAVGAPCAEALKALKSIGLKIIDVKGAPGLAYTLQRERSSAARLRSPWSSALPPSPKPRSEEAVMTPPLLLLVVLYQSLTLGSVPTDCAAALRALTGNPFERAAITHVTQFELRGAIRTFAEPERIVPAASTGLAYTVQGPRNEVGILVCGPAAEEAPAPAANQASFRVPEEAVGGIAGS